MTVEVKITVPDEVDAKIGRLVSDGEFLTEEDAYSQLLSTGIKAYRINGEHDETDVDEIDGMMGHDDEYVF